MTFRHVACLCASGLMAFGAAAVNAQTYPDKPVRLIAGDAGGGGDLVARILVPGLGASLGQPVIVENRGGAGGIIAAQALVKATPDGHTVLLYGNGLWLLPLLRADVPFDPVRDFAPITLATRSPNILVVHPSLQVKSVKELIALAKAKPGTLNYATSGSGASDHLAAELFKSMAAIDTVRVNFKGTAGAVTGVVGGGVQMAFPSAGSALPHIRAGRLRALAVTTAQASAIAPDVPTIAATGLPGYEAGQALAVLAPAKTPSAIVNRLNQDLVRVLGSAEVREKFLTIGVESIGTSVQELTGIIKSDMSVWGKVIKEAGIRDN